MQPKFITTAELARQRGVQTNAIRKRLCLDGSYYGIKPERFASGHLLWPADTLERLLNAPAPRRRRRADGKFLRQTTGAILAPPAKRPSRPKPKLIAAATGK